MALGDFFLQSTSLGPSTNSTTVYQDKITLNTPPLPAGQYYAQASASYRNPTSTRDFEADLTLDGSTVANTQRMHQGDTGPSLADFTLLQELPALAGPHTLKLRFRRQGGLSGDVTCLNARLQFFAVDGSFFTFASSPTADSPTASSTYVNKLTLTTPAVPAGRYRIAWRIGHKNKDKTGNFELRWREDGSTLLEERYNTDGAGSSSSDPNQCVVGIEACRELEAGSYTYTLDYRRSGGTLLSTVTALEASMAFWKFP